MHMDDDSRCNKKKIGGKEIGEAENSKTKQSINAFIWLG